MLGMWSLLSQLLSGAYHGVSPSASQNRWRFPLQLESCAQMPIARHQPRNQSLVRGIALLRAIAKSSPGASAADLAEAVGIPRTTVSRLLATLEELGIVERLPRSRRWIVGSEVARLGRAADPFAALRERGQPLIESIAAEVGETAMIGVVHGNWESEIIIQADAANLMGTTNWLGQRFGGALHASAFGKLALAAFPDDKIRARFGPEFPSFTAATVTSVDALDRAFARGPL